MRIKNWSKLQHFKDRTPPWVKLYRDLLDDPDWHDLNPESAKILVMLWLIASEDETHSGMLPNDRKLSFRLRISEKDLKQHVINLSHWLIQDDIDAISDRYQHDAPERAGEETETETEVEREADAISPEKPSKKKRIVKTGFPEDFELSESTKQWAGEKGVSMLAERVEHFRSVAIAKGYQYADWQQAFQNACRDDWAKLNGKAPAGPPGYTPPKHGDTRLHPVDKSPQKFLNGAGWVLSA